MAFGNFFIDEFPSINVVFAILLDLATTFFPVLLWEFLYENPVLVFWSDICSFDYILYFSPQ